MLTLCFWVWGTFIFFVFLCIFFLFSNELFGHSAHPEGQDPDSSLPGAQTLWAQGETEGPGDWGQEWRWDIGRAREGLSCLLPHSNCSPKKHSGPFWGSPQLRETSPRDLYAPSGPPTPPEPSVPSRKTAPAGLNPLLPGQPPPRHPPHTPHPGTAH